MKYYKNYYRITFFHTLAIIDLIASNAILSTPLYKSPFNELQSHFSLMDST